MRNSSGPAVRRRPGPRTQGQMQDRISPSTDATGIEISNLRKAYGQTVALDDVSLSIEAGEVHALLGENGAGKSTLVKILAGLIAPDRGEVRLDRGPVRLRGARAAHAAGIRTAFQEISLIPDLSVSQNFLLMEEPLGLLGRIDRKERDERVASVLRRFGLSRIPPAAMVRSLDLSTRQKLEIVRAASFEPRILLLDEPTASLSAADVEWLEGILDDARSRRTTVIFISHRLGEVRALCDRLSVLRDGICAGTRDARTASEDEIVEMTIGRRIAAVYPPKPPAPPAAPPVLEARDLTAGAALAGVSLSLRPGQLLGVGGLQGMGQRELFMGLFGAEDIGRGEILIDGAPARLAEPADAVARGIGLVPEERKTEGLFLGMDGRRNLSLPAIDRLSRLGLVRRRMEAAAVRRVLSRVAAPDRADRQKAGQFSGGNQQKLVLGRWFLAESRILLLFDPTRGVDVPTKSEIYHQIADFLERGGSVLFYSSDIAELTNLCTEVLVLYKGRVAARLEGAAVTEMAIMRAALGGQEPRTHTAKAPL